MLLREKERVEDEKEREEEEKKLEREEGGIYTWGESQNHTNSRLAKREIFTVVACKLIWKQN